MQTDPSQESNPTTDAPAPVVERKKKKRKYSKGLRDMQQLERSLSKASERVARSVAKGMKTYRKKSAKSSRKKRDGALRDLSQNLAAGVGKTLRVLSEVPSDLAKAMNGRRAKKRVKKQLRFASRLLRPLG